MSNQERNVLYEKTERLKLNSESGSSRSSSPLKATTQKQKTSKQTVPVTIKKEVTKVQPSLSQFVNSKTNDKTVNMKLIDLIAKKRSSLFSNVSDFKFNKKRVRVLTKIEDISNTSGGILYWMSRDQRVQDNWSLLFAQRLAIKQNLPLHVCFCLVPKFLDATIRHYHFMIEGLKEVEQELRALQIPFHLLMGQAKDRIPEFVQKNSIGAVVLDFTPLRIGKTWIADLQTRLAETIPIVQVDAHNIVPCWIASDKQEYAARTIRNKINSKLDEFLTEFPPVILHEYNEDLKQKPIDWSACYDSLDVDRNVREVDWAKPGYTPGIDALEVFINQRLKFFDTDRNDPCKNALSNLSPWYHYGQVSVQRCILEIKAHKAKFGKAVEAYMEEAIVRRELGDNFCYYQDNYDNLNGAYDWARKTLDDHRKDKRPFLYTKEQFEKGATYDRLWNAAQIQMVKEGKMHGFMRMYWAKKILEWTESPEQALEFAIYLNDKYSLDGRDPNGYVGCMWSIAGIHDQGWAERAIFGKIRYMNYDGCKRKFDIQRYMAKYDKL